MTRGSVQPRWRYNSVISGRRVAHSAADIWLRTQCRGASGGSHGRLVGYDGTVAPGDTVNGSCTSLVVVDDLLETLWDPDVLSGVAPRYPAIGSSCDKSDHAPTQVPASSGCIEWLSQGCHAQGEFTGCPTSIAPSLNKASACLRSAVRQCPL